MWAGHTAFQNVGESSPAGQDKAGLCRWQRGEFGNTCCDLDGIACTDKQGWLRPAQVDVLVIPTIGGSLDRFLRKSFCSSGSE